MVGTIYLKPDSLRLGAHVAYAGYVVAVQAALGWQHNGFEVVGTLPGGQTQAAGLCGCLGDVPGAGGGANPMKVVPLRLAPGDDLRQTLETWMGEQQEQAGCVISAVGSLSVAQLRFAGAAEDTTIHCELEILSLAGTLSPDGAHLHIAVADSRGAVIGGHLCTGSLVRTTAELVVGLLPEWHFWRELDPATGYPELRISPLAAG